MEKRECRPQTAPTRRRQTRPAGASNTTSLARTPDWPSIRYESLDWHLSPDILMSNTTRRKVAGQYDAAVTPDIADLVVQLDQPIMSEAEEAMTEIVRFDAEFGARMVPFASILLRSESTASSRIEQLTATAKAIALAELGDSSRKNATMIVSNVRAMEAAVSLADDISSDSIIAMHTALLEAEHPKWVGHWRDAQVWIGGNPFGPHDAAFIPPHHRRVPGAVDDLVRFAQRTDISPLVHAALAHAQFETIHPFPDGNGRTGRALIHSMLRRRGVTRNITVPISAGLLVDTNAYFASLNAYRDGDPSEIIEQMAGAAFLSIANARALIAELDEIDATWRARIRARSDSSMWRVIDLLFRQPAINSNIIQQQLGISKPAALSAIEMLESSEVLLKAKGQERNRAWVATDIVAALDRFAERSGRRARSTS